jgi:copper chaperone CopZ
MRALFVSMAIVVAQFSVQSAADDKPLKAERVVFRITGLFAPDREKDLRAAFEELPGFTLVSINFDDAEITVAFVPSKVFGNAKPEKFVEQFDQKLRSASSHTFGIKPRRMAARDKLQTIEIPAAGLDCKACCLAAYEAIAGIDGVEQATASFKEGRITALIDPKRTDRTKLEESLRKKGVALGKPAAKK